MSDSGTNFPPQTYSSVFNLNTLSEEDKNVNPEKRAAAKSESSPLLDCFVSSMYWKYFVILFLWYPTIIKAEGSLSCMQADDPKVRIFQTLVQYQANKLSFKPNDKTYDGNYVSFNFTAIDHLPKNSFVTYSVQNIIAIDLRNKSITQVDEGAFYNLNCLFYLDLSNNNISNLTKGIFVGLEHVKTLNFSGNHLTYLYETVFTNLKSIETLDVSFNKIKDLDSSVLDDIPTLEKLMLSYNCMKRIRYRYFVKLVHLKELYFDHNEIAIVPIMLFDKNAYLETLDLSGNGLVVFDMRNDQPVLQSIKNLNLSDNYLINLQIDEFSYHFPNKDLTIDFNNNQFYCSSWKKYLTEFNEKHIKIVPGRNFSQAYYIGGIACDTLNFSLVGTEVDDAFGPNTKPGQDNMLDGATLNKTLKSIVQQLNHKEGELSGKQAKNETSDNSPLVQGGESISHIKDGTGESSNTTKGVTIALAVIGVAFLILVALDYVLGVGFMVKLRWRVRYFLSSSGGDESSEYVTLTHPS